MKQPIGVFLEAMPFKEVNEFHEIIAGIRTQSRIFLHHECSRWLPHRADSAIDGGCPIASIYGVGAGVSRRGHLFGVA